ncbi:MAG TPA: cupredoxin domain-containing protein [Acidimicrobiia bacterium]|nr:cupredoxin domain-containing protein [Acidimicrobiia bacterium]
MRRSQALLVAVAATALLLGACGDGDDAGDETGTSIETTASDFQFDPDSWTVPAGEEFTIEFQNDGTLEHEWAVIGLGEDLESEADFSEDKVLFEVEAIPAGESTTETFTVDEPGTYQVICAIETHFDSGMEGTLTVE